MICLPYANTALLFNIARNDLVCERFHFTNARWIALTARAANDRDGGWAA